ncbi:glycosyltransferase [Flavivirga algicola]|uniref:Glycosyltransferase n=1 Tax=Flavivirga algicola TaxID=2729136 RepID=A0ABX1RZW9_9FLAO|nr:glycosyltransferase [Flavivirga algicola]NMH88333.1 glycosyltransferase [Flavivirga algicola]
MIEIHSEDTVNDLKPMVSIIVITYNSSKYLLDTLMSAKNQSYHNIELIISDDGSTDDTKNICEEWLQNNKDRFIGTELITVQKNTGIPANLNRGLKKAKGEWLKFIAGDDILDINCVKSYMDFVNKDQLKPSFLFSNLVFFQNSIDNIVRVDQIDKLITKKQKHQFLDYLCDRPTITPSGFISKEILVSLGGYNEKYRLLEDVPLFIKALRKGIPFNLLNENLVYYRISEVSISNDSENSNSVSKLFLQSIQQYYNFEIYPELLKRFLILNYLKAKVKFRFASTGKYPNNIVTKVMYKLIIKLALFEKKTRLFFK